MLVEYYSSDLISVEHSLSSRLKVDSTQQDYAATHQSGLLSRLRLDSVQPEYAATHQLGINHHSHARGSNAQHDYATTHQLGISYLLGIYIHIAAKAIRKKEGA